jgi:hypothetical protein
MVWRLNERLRQRRRKRSKRRQEVEDERASIDREVV